MWTFCDGKDNKTDVRQSYERSKTTVKLTYYDNAGPAIHLSLSGDRFLSTCSSAVAKAAGHIIKYLHIDNAKEFKNSDSDALVVQNKTEG